MSSLRERFRNQRVTAVLAVPGFLLGCLVLGACTQEPKIPQESGSAPHPHTARLLSSSCKECHAQQSEEWAGTDHARANRQPESGDRAALVSFPGGALPTVEGRSPLVLGNLPLWQPLVPTARGRWQAHELAFDPGKREWFNVFGSENRREGEWGHWSGRGMNWNSMCAHCHMTGFKTGYAELTDTYHSTWIEHGVGCVQCHGETSLDHGAVTAKSGLPAETVTLRNRHDPFQGDRTRWMHACATCHARQEAISSGFKPGDDYHEHYRVALPTQPGVYFPDGQQLDENFNWTSVLLSRMGHSGVTCMDCHDPHTTRTVLPVENNALCMQCHSAPGRVMPSGVLAVPIDPTAHSRHKHDSTGNSCVACHMPTRTYMQRAPRHDHGWLKPDPLLTKELGIPNACSTCHQKEGLDWVIAKADEWYGERLDSRQRARARAVAAAQRGDQNAADALLTVLSKEDIPAWRATLLELVGPFASSGAPRVALEAGLRASSPLERAAAVRGLSRAGGAEELLEPLLGDASRLVRLDAAWALSARLAQGSSIRAELDAYLALSIDQPGGLARRGMDLHNRGRSTEAINDLERAMRWDATSAAIPHTIGRILTSQGKPREAAERYALAAKLEPGNADYAYAAALSHAEVGDSAKAEEMLRSAVRSRPDFDRAWYNLGLLLASRNDLAGARDALAKAEKLRPGQPDYPYALATLHLRSGDTASALAALRRARTALRAGGGTDADAASLDAMIRSLEARQPAGVGPLR